MPSRDERLPYKSNLQEGRISCSRPAPLSFSARSGSVWRQRQITRCFTCALEKKWHKSGKKKKKASKRSEVKCLWRSLSRPGCHRTNWTVSVFLSCIHGAKNSQVASTWSSSFWEQKNLYAKVNAYLLRLKKNVKENEERGGKNICFAVDCFSITFLLKLQNCGHISFQMENVISLTVAKVAALGRENLQPCTINTTFWVSSQLALHNRPKEGQGKQTNKQMHE